MAATIHVPDISTKHIQLGLIDSSDPQRAVDNKPFNELRQSGALIFRPEGLSDLRQGGDFINVPAVAELADLDRVDIASDTDLTPAEVDTDVDIAVVQHDKKVYTFKASDRIRSGHDASEEYSMKFGGKVAKKLFANICNTVIGAIDAVDTPSTNCHTLSIYNANTPAYPTLEYLRQCRALLGDRAQELTTAVLTSASYERILKDLIANWGGGSVIGDSAAQRGMLGTLLGITNWIVNDNVPQTSSANNILLLGAGSIWAGYQAEPEVEEDKDILKPSSRKLLALSASVVTHLRFVKYVGTANPTDAALATASNWDEAYDNHKRVLAAKLVCN